MIHSHRPGEHIHIGLNFEFGMRGRWPWLTLIWCWYDLATRETYGWRLRIRTHMRPFKLFSVHRQDVIESYLNDHDAWGWFSALDLLITTGPTRTNVNDYRTILLL